jgi:hypothetical protein
MAAMSISTHNTKFWRSAALSAFLISRDFAARKTRTPCKKKLQIIAWITPPIIHIFLMKQEGNAPTGYIL